MPRQRKKDHASRIVENADGKTECVCGRTFDDDAAWRRHYEKETTAKQRAVLEGRAESKD